MWVVALLTTVLAIPTVISGIRYTAPSQTIT